MVALEIFQRCNCPGLQMWMEEESRMTFRAVARGARKMAPNAAAGTPRGRANLGFTINAAYWPSTWSGRLRGEVEMGQGEISLSQNWGRGLSILSAPMWSPSY